MPKSRNLEGNEIEIIRAMKESSSIEDFRRIQCVYLGVRYPEMPARKIGEITFFSESRVWAIHAKYRKNGISGLRDSRGGRYHEYLSFEEEEEFLKQFEEKYKAGALSVAGSIKKAYEELVGKKVSKTTIYRLLVRHEFRKIVPYKRHKKANVEEQEAFKKTF